MGRLRLVMVPDRIKDAVPEGYREKRAAQFLGVGIHLFRGLVKNGKIVPRLLGKTRIYLRQDLERFLRGLPVDRNAQYPSGQKGRPSIDQTTHSSRDHDFRFPVAQDAQSALLHDAQGLINRGPRFRIDRTSEEFPQEPVAGRRNPLRNKQ